MALIGEGTAGPSQARLDFIRDERCAVVAGQFASARPKCGADRIDAAFSLDWFDNNSANRVVEFGFQISDVVKAHKFDSGHQRTKWLAVFRGMRYGKRAEGAPMKRIFKRQDTSFSFCTALVRGQSCQFDCAFDSFCAAISEKDAHKPGPLRQLARQRALVWVMKQI